MMLSLLDLSIDELLLLSRIRKSIPIKRSCLGSRHTTITTIECNSKKMKIVEMRDRVPIEAMTEYNPFSEDIGFIVTTDECRNCKTIIRIDDTREKIIVSIIGEDGSEHKNIMTKVSCSLYPEVECYRVDRYHNGTQSLNQYIFKIDDRDQSDVYHSWMCYRRIAIESLDACLSYDCINGYIDVTSRDGLNIPLDDKMKKALEISKFLFSVKRRSSEMMIQ